MSMMPFELFLSLRYLQPKRTFVSVITLISVMGVTLGVGVLIIVISVMTGFDAELRHKLLGFNIRGSEHKLFICGDHVRCCDHPPIRCYNNPNPISCSWNYVLSFNWCVECRFLSNEKIDDMYQWALEAGAIGGKVCGAGGGGFLLLYVPMERQEAVKRALRKHREFPFMLEKYGSRIIFNHKADYWR